MNPRLSLGLRSQLPWCASCFLIATSLFPSAASVTPIPDPVGNASPKAISWSEVGVAAGAQYSGDGLMVTMTEHGARLHCVFQRLEGEATREGLWLSSSVTNQAKDRFRVTATAIGGQALPRDGIVAVDGQIVRFSRTGLIEEYSVSMDGVRQDFVVLEKPGGASVPASRLARSLASPAHGQLRLDLTVNGARVEQIGHGAQLVLDSGRRIAYSRLRVTDANGRDLPARIEVPDNSALRTSRSTARMAVIADDSDAKYPIRIDPTFSDANWVSFGGINGADIQIYATAVDSSGNLYIGGYFTLVGNVAANGVAKWDGTNWTALGVGVNNMVRALGVLGGEVYAGGMFTAAGGSNANYVAKWNGAAWSPLGSGVGAGVYALALSGTDLYVGGDFTTAGGSNANYVAKWNGSAWSTLGSGLGGSGSSVRALMVSGNDLYAGGSFTTAGGSPVNFIAKWDGNAWGALGSGVSGGVSALALSGSDVYVGGGFLWATNIGGIAVAANRIAKWSGTAWTALGSGVDGIDFEKGVYALAISGSDVYVGGNFTTAGGIGATNIAKWNGTWTPLKSGVDDWVHTLSVSGSDLFVGGQRFGTAGGVPAHRIAKWNGSAWSALWPGINDWVDTLTVSGSEVYAGGYFTVIGGVLANHVAKWNGSGWSAFGAGVNGVVRSLAVSNSNVYAGGDFTMAGAVAANRIAKWNGTVWSALGSGMGGGDGFTDPIVAELEVSGSNVYAGGSFTTAGGITANYIAKWNGSNWSALGLGMNKAVYTMSIAGNDLYAGGAFTTAGGNTALRMAKWNGSDWSALGAGLNDSVSALAWSGSELYVAGNFTTAGGFPANRVAKWDGTNWSALGTGLGFTVLDLVASESGIYAAGRFSSAGGNTAIRYIARWDGSTWNTLGSGVNWYVRALTVLGNDVYAGGEFTFAGGRISAYMAKWSPLAFEANSVNVSNGVFLALLTGPDTNNVVVDRSINFTNWTPQVTNTLPLGGAWQLSLPTGTNPHQFYRARLGP